MTMATTTIRIDIDTLPEHLDRSHPAVVAEAIEDALREGGIKADCSDLFSHIKIDLPTAQLATASAVLVDLQLISGNSK
jgi:predicted transcriptional regulator